MVDVKALVAEKLAASGSAVQEAVISKLVQETLDKRVSIIVAAFAELDKAQKELYKAKPDIVSYDENGTVVSSAYSKAVLDARKKASERIVAVRNAIDKALEGNDFGPVSKVTGSKDGGD